jgi:hypothetical protein
LRLCDKITSDSALFYSLNLIADIATGARRESRFTKEQIGKIADDIRQFAGKSYRRSGFIQHDGYRIITEALALKVRAEKGSHWHSLADRARQIPNISDRVLVICTLAESAVEKERDLSCQLLEEAKDIALTLPSTYERAMRLATVADSAFSFDKAIAKAVISAGAEAASRSDGEGIRRVERRLIDLAHAIDPDWAAQIVEQRDQDPARVRRKAELQSRLNVLRDATRPESGGRRGTPAELPETCWRSLALLNGNQISPRGIETFGDELSAIAEMPLSESYPIIAWVVGNCVAKHSRTKAAGAKIRPLFEALLTSSRITAHLTGTALLNDGLDVGRKMLREGGLVEPGDQHAAKDMLTSLIGQFASAQIDICDPYFGPSDMWLLKLIKDHNPDARVRILTSSKALASDAGDPAEAFLSHWKDHVSSADPPNTRVIIVTWLDENCPIHDRWMVAGREGLRFGTSVSGLGKRLSEVSAMTSAETEEVMSKIEPFLEQRHREYAGRRIKYRTFEL